MDEPAEDQLFRAILAKSDLKLTDPNFEDSVMREIGQLELQRERFSRKIRLSWLCFTAGAVFGVALSLLLSPFQLALFGIRPDTVQLGLQFLLALAILLGLDQLWTSTSRFFRTGDHLRKIKSPS